MRIEQEVIFGKTTPFTLDDLWNFRKELKEAFGAKLDEKLNQFSDTFLCKPESFSPEDRFVAYKIFWMMKLIPLEPNPN